MAKKGQKQKERKKDGNAKQRKSSPGATAAAKGSEKKNGAAVHRGLVNLGNTCFLNSILQCLNVSRPFSDELDALSQGFAGASFCSALCNIFRGIRGQESSKSAVNPKPLLSQLISKFPWYAGKEQQDAHELLRTLLGSLCDEPSNAEKKNAKSEVKRPPGTPAGCAEQMVWDNFRGHWAVAVLCWNCGKVSMRLDPFLDISLELLNTTDSWGPLGVSASARKAVAPSPNATKPKAASPKKEAADQEVGDLLAQASPPEAEAGDGSNDGAAGGSEADGSDEDGADKGLSLSKRELKKKQQQKMQKRKAEERAAAAAATAAAAAAAVAAKEAAAAEAAKEAVEDVLDRALSHVMVLGISHAFVTQLSDWCSKANAGDTATPNGRFVFEFGEDTSAGEPAGCPALCAAGQCSADCSAEASPTSAAVRAKLEHLRVSTLRKQAISLGASEEEITAAEDADNEKTALIELIIAQKAAACAAGATEGQDPDASTAAVDATVVEADATITVPEAAAAEPPEYSFEVQLACDAKANDGGRWGFEWDSEELGRGRMLVFGVTADSPADKWNLKRRAMGDQESIVTKGDRLLSVDGCKTRKGMEKALKDDSNICLVLARQARPEFSCPASSSTSKADANKKGKKGKKARHNSDNESGSDKEFFAEKKVVNAAAVLEASRQSFCEHADRCKKKLPKEVLKTFSCEELQAPEASKTCELTDCFRQFYRVEAIEEDFAPSYQCAECMKPEENGKSQRVFASRRAWLWNPLPRLITVQLKRFRRKGQRFEKASAKVATPAVLDLGAFVMTEAEHKTLVPHLSAGTELKKPSASSSSLLYELYGVCVHIGSTMHGGHYIAYVNRGSSLESEEWYSISDSQVSRCSRKDALEAEAYVAFYRREGVLKEEPKVSQDDGSDAGGGSSEGDA